jgi:quercetin dioxygenase-like cupin family protein
MNRFLSIAALLCCLAWPSASRAEEYANLSIDKLAVSSKSYTGQPLCYSRTDTPEVTALVLHVPPGESTGWHKHPVPVYAYVLEGEMTVEIKDGGKYTFKKGEVILEAMNIMHNGYNSGKELTSLLVFYTGAEGVPNVIRKDTPAAQEATATPELSKSLRD